MPEADRVWPPATADGAFATTQWTMIFDAARDGDAESDRALANLCESYWHPVYAFVRHRGNPPEEAKDLTQGFFAHLLEKRSFGAASPEKGKFRTYLLGAVKFFLSNEFQKAMAQKRGGGAAHVSIDAELAEEWLGGQLAEAATPEVLFERQWARTVLDDVRRQLRGEFAKKEKAALFEILEPFLAGAAGEIRYVDIAALHGGTEASVKMAASRMRKRFGELLRAKVAETVDSEEAVDEELRNLVSAFRQ